MNEKNISYYNENATTFFETTVNADMSLWRDKFEKTIPDGGRILDVGCGSGRDSKAFLKHGFSVVAIDASSEMCRMASEYLGMEVWQMRFDEMSFTGEFDGVWACASLLHAEDELPEVLQKIKKALKKDGMLYVSFKYGEGRSEKGSRTFVNFTEESIVKLLSPFGFTVKEIGISEDVRPDRPGEKWINAIAVLTGKKYKIIATDLDNTALNKESRLSVGNRKAFEKAIENGIEVVVATGRGLSGIPADILAVEGIKYTLTSNGACFYNIRTGEVLQQFTILPEDAKKLVEIGHRNNATYEIFVGGNAYVSKEYYEDPVSFGMPERLYNYIHNTRKPVEDIDAFISENIGKIENFAFVMGSMEVHRQIEADVAKECAHVFVTSADPQWVEVMSDESGKGKGLKHACEYLGIDLSESVAFGDGDNDVEMLRYAGFSVSVSNGSDLCRQSADFISSSNDSDGVARGISLIL